jgi:phosphatidate cytidylyltransferase
MNTEALVLLTIAVSFGAAAALIGLVGLHPNYRAQTQELWAFYNSEFLIIGGLLVPTALGGWYFAAALIVLCRRGQMEMFRLFDAPVWGAEQAVAAVAACALVIAATLKDFVLLGVVFGSGIVAVALAGLIMNPKQRVLRSVIGAATLVYPSLLAALVAALRATADGFAWVFFVYATVEIADTFALLLGKLFGRVRVFPRLSPGKTAEGLTAGFCLGGIAGGLLAHGMVGLPWTESILAAGAILIVGLAGDLLASTLKRWRKKKDFAPVLRLHGGALDIYDSFLLAAPAALLLRPFLAA